MQEITLYADRGNAEAIGDMLMEAGASSYTTQDADADTPSESPLFGEPGLEPKVQAWNRSLLTVLADDGFDWKTSLAVIEKALGIEKLEVKSVEAVPDVDWVRITQAQFQPIQASRRLWIVPSWSEPPSPDALNMKLDPGVAFGTGSHPTTHLCIQWLDAKPFLTTAAAPAFSRSRPPCSARARSKAVISIRSRLKPPVSTPKTTA